MDMEEMLMKYLRKIHKDLKQGEKIEVLCPCGGKLSVSRDKLNNHISIYCKSCKFSLMQ